MVLITEIYSAESLASKTLTVTEETHFVMDPKAGAFIELSDKRIRLVPTNGFLRIEAI